MEKIIVFEHIKLTVDIFCHNFISIKMLPKGNIDYYILNSDHARQKL